MDFNEIQKLANLIKESDLHELEIERGNMRLKIVNQGGGGSPIHHVSPVYPIAGGQLPTPAKDDNISNPKQQEEEEEDSKLFHIIRSPIVGTFYSAPSPEAPSFVAKDVPVDINSTVGIIEAMKVMNEILAEVKGIVVEVLVENGQPVEFGQPLFKIKKS